MTVKLTKAKQKKNTFILTVYISYMKCDYFILPLM